MFSFKIDVAQLNKIIPFCGAYIDIMQKGNMAILCSESGQAYVQYVCSALNTNPNEATNVRVDTNLLVNMALDGKIDIEVLDSEVCLSFYNDLGQLSYKTFVPRQISYINLEEKLDIFQRANSCESYSLIKEQKLIRLASKVKTPFIINEGFAYMFYNRNYVFHPSECPAFAVDSDLLKKSISLSLYFKVVGDYLVFKDESVSIILQKQKLPLMSDIPYLVKYKAKKCIEVDLSKLTHLLSRIKSDKYSIRLNLDAEKCFINNDTNKFEVPVEVIDDSSKNKSLDDMLSNLGNGLDLNQQVDKTYSVLVLPYWLPKVLERTSKVTIYITKRFSIIKFGHISVTIGGSV